MTRPEGEVPPCLEFSDADTRRYFTNPLFHAQVFVVAQVLTCAYGTERNEALAFGMKAVKCLESVAPAVEPITGY